MFPPSKESKTASFGNACPSSSLRGCLPAQQPIRTNIAPFSCFFLPLHHARTCSRSADLPLCRSAALPPDCLFQRLCWNTGMFIRGWLENLSSLPLSTTPELFHSPLCRHRCLLRNILQLDSMRTCILPLQTFQTTSVYELRPCEQHFQIVQFTQRRQSKSITSICSCCKVSQGFRVIPKSSCSVQVDAS